MSTPKAAPIAYILDDDAEFIKLISVVFKKYGITTESFKSSEAFMEKMCQKAPSICILDLNVESPNSSIQLLKDIRSGVLASVPILITSSDHQPTSIAHALESGADDYLLKPLHREILVSKLLRYIESRELLEEALELPKAPDVAEDVVLEIGSRLIEVDELGIKIACDHLINKGCTLALQAPIFEEIFGRSKPILFTVVSTWVENDEGVYGAYLEFDSHDTELGNQVRTWITRKSA